MNDLYFEFEEDVLNVNLSNEKPRVTVYDKFTVNKTLHEAVFPYKHNYNKMTLNPKVIAKSYKFELDTFQKLAIESIERDESILVSAHTSCGKTVVAEYAIAQSIANKQRVVYTSPIKALSNQKYRELQSEFNDVGLMTGDVTLNPEASCLVMTTEILRNMLYRGSEVIREVHWIIFDEIHYMRDKERGVVWEETIILMPPHCRMVFLSATIPNALEFASWIAYTCKQIVHVVYTEKRVIPLNHYFFSDDLYHIKGHEKGDDLFLTKNFNSAVAAVDPKLRAKNIPLILEKASLPSVVFSFSRKDCEKLAIMITSDYNNEEEKEMVRLVFKNALKSLRKEDRELAFIESMLPLLERGIGIHHSGLIPILKETVELLFQESLIKVLFATETFSIGLNMPCRTVIFTNLKKFDGEKRRFLNPSEYIQMSGRAGRRGIDKEGSVIVNLTDVLGIKQAKKILNACSDTLESSFRLTYNMVLNFLAVEDLDPLNFLGKSFYHYQAYSRAREQEKLLKPVEIKEGNELSDLLKKRCEIIAERNIEMCESLKDYLTPKRVVSLVFFREGATVYLQNAIIKKIEEDVNCLALIDGELEGMKIKYSNIMTIYKAEVNYDPTAFDIKYIKVKYNGGFNDKINEIEEKIHKIHKIDFKSCLFCDKRDCRCKYTPFNEYLTVFNDEKSKKVLTNTKLKKTGNTILKVAREHIKSLLDYQNFIEKYNKLKELKEIYHMDECKRMINVLESLEYIKDRCLLIKGRMASKISSADEILLTEMIFTTDFPELDIPSMLSLLSCLVFEENINDDKPIDLKNYELYTILAKTLKRIVDVKQSNLIPEIYETALLKFNTGMMDVVRMWATGYTFFEICESTSIFEGSIIRCLRRLEEMLRQLCDAAHVIGNNDLVNKFTQGIFLIKRDIVFANSLYL